MAYLLFYHYIIFLNREISIKISKISSKSRKKQRIAYHFLTFAITFCACLAVFFASNNGKDFGKNTIYKVRAYQYFTYYITCTTFCLLVYIGKHYKMILSYKSSEFNSLLLVTLSVCIFNILGIIIPQLLATFGKADSPEYYEISDWILSGSGIFPPIARLANKRFCRLLSFRRQKLIKYNPFQEMGIIKEQGIVTYQPLESVLISEVLEHEKKNVSFLCRNWYKSVFF